MNFLKKFDLNTQYEAAKDGFIYPNVSYVKEDDMLYYELPPIEYEYVDLGLPSGLLWATMNIGARKPEESGLYFQWGDTVGYTADQVGSGEGQKYFGWSDYKMSSDGSGNATAMTNYNSTDGKDILELTDDAAHVLMGGSWRMPTMDEYVELLSGSTTTKHLLLTIDGGDVEWEGTWDGDMINWNSGTTTGNNITVKGMEFRSTVNGNKLFFPAAGIAGYGAVGDVGYYGRCWSSSLLYSSVGSALYFNFSPGNGYVYAGFRFYGLPLRGVLPSK